MVEAIMLWNEPNNKSHWDFEIDKEWALFSEMMIKAATGVAAESSAVIKLLGGISPIDPLFILRMKQMKVLNSMDAVAVHGFPLDWNHWMIDEWPQRIAEIEAVTDLPIWVSEAGVSSFGAEEVQEFGFRRTAELLLPRLKRLYWYSLFDLPQIWGATTRHREAEGSSYYRHFHMGLVQEDGTPKRALRFLYDYTPHLGICQWFHFEDPRIEHAVRLMQDFGVKKVRTGLSWADSLRPGADKWFDCQMKLLDGFDVTLTYCFTPECEGIAPHHTSPPKEISRFADFCAKMTRRYTG